VAEQLYLQLLAADVCEAGGDAEGGGSDAESAAAGGSAGAAAASSMPVFQEDVHEQALDLLLTTPWDGPLDGARQARNALAALLGLEVKARPAAAAQPGAGAAAAAAAGVAKLRVAADENASYQSLLDDAARGGGY
jgi:hypothetical protein